MVNLLRILSEEWRISRGTGLVNQFFLINYRLGRAAFNNRQSVRGIFILPIYYILLLNSRALSLVLGCSVPFSANLGRRIRFQHGLQGVFISGLATIGDDCLILHQVTIGSNIGGRSRRPSAPRIGSNVFIGAGAKIIGDLNIGDNVMVGAQALIVHSIPPYARCHAPIAEVRVNRQA